MKQLIHSAILAHALCGIANAQHTDTGFNPNDTRNAQSLK